MRDMYFFVFVAYVMQSIEAALFFVTCIVIKGKIVNNPPDASNRKMVDYLFSLGWTTAEDNLLKPSLHRHNISPYLCVFNFSLLSCGSGMFFVYHLLSVTVWAIFTPFFLPLVWAVKTYLMSTWCNKTHFTALGVMDYRGAQEKKSWVKEEV